MKKLSFLAATAALLAVPGTAMAVPIALPVAGNITQICGLSLATVTTNALSLANGDKQKLATIALVCNTAGAKIVRESLNGDFKSPAGQIINYDWSFDVPAPDGGLGWAPEDELGPGQAARTSSQPNYSFTLAGGAVKGDFFVDLCYSGPGPICNGSTSAAVAAPAGVYSETFSFELSPL